jgi:hypothetical protein
MTLLLLIILAAASWRFLDRSDTPAARRWRALVRSRSTFADPISGTAILVSLAVSAASTAASYIATRLLTPRPKPIDRGKVDDIRIQGSEYGATRPRIFGTVRLAGNIIWSSGVKTHIATTNQRQGGKGGGGRSQPVNDYSYSTSLAVFVCEGPISGIRKIWANEKVVFNDLAPSSQYQAEAAILGGTATVISGAGYSGGQGVTGGGTITFTPVDAYNGAGVYELALAYYAPAASSVNVSIDGAAPTAHALPATSEGANSSLIVLDQDLGAGSSHTITLSGAGASVVFDSLSVLSRVEIPDLDDTTGLVQPGLEIFDDLRRHHLENRRDFDASPGGSRHLTIARGGMANVRIYTGTETQEPDSLLVSVLGAAHTPAYLGSAYVVFEGYMLEHGNVPNFTFLVDESTRRLDLVVTKVYDLVGVPADRLEVSDLAGDVLDGYILEARGPARRVLEDLQLVFGFDLAEVDGKVRATKRGAAPRYTIPRGHLRAHEWGQEVPAVDAVVSTTEEIRLPRRVEVNYLDPERDYHTNTQGAIRYTGHTFDSVTVNLPMALSATAAKRLAETILFEAHASRRSLKFQVGPRYIDLAPNDVVRVELREATHEIKVTQVQISLTGGVVKVEGVSTQAGVHVQTATGSTGDGFEAPVARPRAGARLAFLDVPSLDARDPRLGYYLGASRAGAGDYEGALAYEEQYQTGSYEQIATLPIPATVGVAATALAEPSGPVDDVNQVTVDLLDDLELESVPFEELLNSTANTALLGRELIQYQTATPQAAVYPYKRRYALGGRILRGLLGTDYLLNFGRGAGHPQPPRRAVTYAGLTNAQVTPEGGLTRPSSISPVGSFDAGAVSAELFEGGDFSIDFAAPAGSNAYSWALDPRDSFLPGLGPSGAFALRFANDELYTFIDGVTQNGGAPVVTGLTAGTPIRLSIEGGQVRVRTGQALTLRHTFAASPASSYPFRFHMRIWGSPSGGTLGPAVWRAAAHYAGEPFVLLNGALKRIEATPADLFAERNLKAVAVGHALEDVRPNRVRLLGNSARAWAPAVRASRDQAGNLLVELAPRSRELVGMVPGRDDLAGLGSKRFKLEVIAADRVRVLRPIPILPQAPEAVAWETTHVGSNATGGKFSGVVSGHSIAGSATGNNEFTIWGRSMQRVSRPGNFVEATLKAIAATATLGLISAGAGYATATPDYRIELSEGGAGAELAVYQGSTLLATKNISATYDAAEGVRVRITVAGTEVRFHVDYRNGASPPLAVAATAPTFPLRIYGKAKSNELGGTSASLGNVMFTEWSTPSTIYTAAQIRHDFGLGALAPLPSSIMVRAFEEDDLAGRGFETEIEI